MTLFSIAVHEQPKVIVNQVENFRFFNSGCQIVLHFSAAMPKEEVEESKRLLADFAFVHINDTRLWSGYGDGTQMKMHVVNFLFAKKQNLEFDYFCLHASNDMFVNFGLYGFMRKYDAGFHLPQDIDGAKWVHYQRALGDWQLKSLIRKYNLKCVLGGQVEGSFYKKSIFDVIANRIMEAGFFEIPRLYAHGTSERWASLLKNKWVRALQKKLLKGLMYAKEEIYFITLSQDLVQHRAKYTYCYINWLNGLNVTKEDILNIRNRNYEALVFHNKPDFSTGEIEFFAVKRIDRKMDDPIRLYINSLQQ